MIGGKKTEQTSGDGGTNIAVEGPAQFNITGIDEKRAREIIQEMLRSQIDNLIREAKELALSRADQFENKFIDRIQRLENGFDSLRRPDVQFALLDAKRNYAESGDESASNISIDMIAEYISREENNYSNPIFREAIKVAPKLSGKLVDIVSMLFFV